MGALHGIGFHLPNTVGIEDFVLVDLADTHTWNEQFPYAGRPKLAHGMATAVPAIEIADNADGMSIGSPHREGCAFNIP